MIIHPDVVKAIFSATKTEVKVTPEEFRAIVAELEARGLPEVLIEIAKLAREQGRVPGITQAQAEIRKNMELRRTRPEYAERLCGELEALKRVRVLVPPAPSAEPWADFENIYPQNIPHTRRCRCGETIGLDEPGGLLERWMEQHRPHLAWNPTGPLEFCGWCGAGPDREIGHLTGTCPDAKAGLPVGLKRKR